MNNENNNEIKPCPFCGGQVSVCSFGCTNGAPLADATYYSCFECRVIIRFDKTYLEALALYNSRKGNNNA